MKMTSKMKKLFSAILCVVLIVAMALVTTGCAEKGENDSQPPQSVITDAQVMGEGSTAFSFCVVDKEGKETFFEVHTDKKTVGEALLDCKLIEGEMGDYGLYVKTVNGIVADYDVDGTYWAFYINGEYAMTGVDTTDIVAGDSYAMKVEK